MKQKLKPDYGIDSPFLGLRIFSMIVAVAAAGIYLYGSSNAAAKIIGDIIISLVPSALLILILMYLYIRIGKFMHRDRMLNMLSWNGDEQVLDIGTGHGLLMIGAAKRLTYGRSYGIDIWNEEDMSDNSYQSAMRNAEIESVCDRIEIMNADARGIPFPGNSFDYILSHLCLHNIRDRAGRITACAEIARVLKPGGTALISDFRYAKEYADELAKCGLKTSRSTVFVLGPMILTIVKAVK